MAGKTGADAVFNHIRSICHTVTRYRSKLDAVITAAEVASIITAAQATAAHDFVAGAQALCVVFEAVATYNSITP